MTESSGKIRERWTYDVFLNFRGPDMRNGLIGHLYKSLVRSGIYVFKDDEELERGEDISPKLLKAIENSKIHLAVLSPNYASSRWCLDELVHIMQCRERETGHMLLPIFFDVHPADVRVQIGSFAEAFHKHRSRYTESQVQTWKATLASVAHLRGFVNGVNDAELIEDITRDILQRLPSSYLHLPTYGVGIKSRVYRINELLCFDSDDVQTIGLCGMGGIGKTTLAKAAYNEYSHSFEGTSFLENFGESFKKPQGKVHLQQKLLSDILRRHDKVFNNMDHAVKQRFRNKRVLVVLDNVEDIKQLNSTAIDWNCFGPGSRIIITSRNKHLLEQLGVVNIYSPDALNGKESLELVSWHSFRTTKPPVDFRQVSEKLVEYCGGLPLAMEVLGAFLFKRSISEWTSTLELLKQTPNADIQAKLRISFDALDPEQKEIFLDISCFFIGMDKDYVNYILDGCKLYPDIGLNVLKERFLVTVRDNRLVMHGLLRDMGRNIVRGTSRSNCERWSRLWDPDDAIEVLANNSGTDAIGGLSIKVGATDVENLEAEAFSNLLNLRLLQLSHVRLKGSYEYFPRGLRWFCWFEYPQDSIPIKLHLESVVVMDLQFSNLKQLWYNQKPQFLRKLKYLDLSHSLQLTETPDFWYLPNMEKLLLINCKKLVLVHKTIRILNRKLVLLNFKGCTELRDLPVELYKLKSLETLILSGCSQLERLDDALGELESLTTLKADFTALRKLPSSSSQLKKLKELSLDGCKDLWKGRDTTHSDESPQESLPTTLSLTGLTCIPTTLSLTGLTCLVTLSLGSCNLSDELIPEDLGSLSCLEELDLQGNNFRNLQTDFAGLLSLQILKLDSCAELESMFSLPKKLRSFFASNCIMLERTPDLSGCLALQSLHLTNCFNLVETPGLDTLKRVGVIHMEMCKGISDTYRERIMQKWAVDGNGGIFVPGSSLPNWVSFKNEKHSISFTVPKSLNPDDLVGFTLWTPYVSQQNDMLSAYSSRITLKNQTKGDIWSLNPATDHIRMYREKHIWQGHFSNEDYNLQIGDQVEVSVDFGDQISILETGLSFAYREEDTDSSDSHTSEIGHDEIIDEQLVLTEASVDDELVMEETQSKPRRKIGMGLKTLVGAFGLLTMTVIVLGKHNGLLHRQNRLRNIEGGKNKEKDARLKFFSRQGFFITWFSCSTHLKVSQIWIWICRFFRSGRLLGNLLRSFLKYNALKDFQVDFMEDLWKRLP